MLKTRSETAAQLRISTMTLDRMVKAGILIPCRVGRRVLFSDEGLAEFINGATVAPKADTPKAVEAR